MEIEEIYDEQKYQENTENRNIVTNITMIMITTITMSMITTVTITT